jgi:hypothetical protein
MRIPCHGNKFTVQLPNDNPGTVVFTGRYQARAFVPLLAWRSLPRKGYIRHKIWEISSSNVSENQLSWSIIFVVFISSSKEMSECCVSYNMTASSLINHHISYLISRCFLVWLILRHWRWKQHVSSKCRLTFNRLQSVISKKIGLFIILFEAVSLLTLNQHIIGANLLCKIL